MTWEEIFKHLSSKEIEDAEQDMDWILTALEDPTYLMVKQDSSNQFLLKHSNMYYIEYIKKGFAEKGYILTQAGRFSNAVSIISERDARAKATLRSKATQQQIESKEESSGSEGIEPGD